MDSDGRRQELGRFLRDRRGRIRPSDVGLPDGARRRVMGLRREEVATLAGVGVTWYTMLENGSAPGVSVATLAAVAKALRLSPAEIAYLTRLTADHAVLEPRAEPGVITRGALVAIEWAPAYVCTSQWTVLAWNRAMSLVWGIEAPGASPFNIVELMFRDEHVRAMHGDNFRAFATALVAMVRSGVASRLEDPAYRRMYDDLRDDPVFAAAWNGYDVAVPLGSIPTVVESAVVGTFAYEAITLAVPDESGHSIVVQVPDEPSASRLRSALNGTGARV